MNEVELFLKKIRKENPKDYFLIMKFYKKPNSLLYSTKEEVKDGIYYNEDMFNNYFKNINFFEFLRIFDFSTLNYYELVSLTRLLKNVRIEDELLISELKLKTNIYLKNKFKCTIYLFCRIDTQYALNASCKIFLISLPSSLNISFTLYSPIVLTLLPINLTLSFQLISI